MTRQFILFNMRSTFSPKILAKGQYSVCVCGIDSTLHSTPFWIRSFAHDALFVRLDCISREFCSIEDEDDMCFLSMLNSSWKRKMKIKKPFAQ